MSDIVDILKQVTNSILKHEPTAKILQKVTELVCEKLLLDVCSIYTYDNKNKLLSLRANTGFLKKAKVSFSINEGLTGLVFREQNTINLTRNGGDRAATARTLGISESVLAHKMREYGLS